MSFHNALVLQDLPEMKPVKAAIGDTDILLIREGDSVHAYQAKCPHAGGPLNNGAICEGKLVCPWHKAEFRVSDGTMLEPLALSHLKRYPVRIENGMVQVDPNAIPTAPKMSTSDQTPVYVILGTGAAGSAAAWTLRDEGFRGKLLLIERETEAPYDRTTLSKFVPSGKMKIEEVPPILDDGFAPYAERYHGDIERLDSREQRLHFADGTTLEYDKLLLASGGVPQRPDIEGKALFGVEVLRSIEQAETLLQQVDKSQKLVIIGNSFIGMEVASALRSKEVDVQVIARHPLPFKKQFGEQIAQFFRDLHEENGVRFVEGEIDSLQGKGQVTGVKLKNGEIIAADVVLLATGIAPATDYIDDIGLQQDGSLRTDATLQVAKNLWAAGDIATYPTEHGEQRIEHYRVAHQQGRVAAKNMLGRNEKYDRVPFFWTTHYGTRYEYLGHASEWDEFRLMGSLADKKFIALYGQQGRLAAISSCGMYTLTAELLIRMRQPMSMQQVSDLIAERL